MFFEQDYDEERLRADTILFWGVVGPQTGLAVVLADRPVDLIEWMRERARVEGRSSQLARALIAVEHAFEDAGDDPYLAADAIGSTLEEAGVPFFACGPILREMASNDLVRARLSEEVAGGSAPEGVWRGGEPHVELEVTRLGPTANDGDEQEKAYRLEEDEEDLAEHVAIDFERVDHREFLIEQLEALKAPPPEQRAA